MLDLLFDRARSLSKADYAAGGVIFCATYALWWVYGYVRVRLQVRDLPTIHSWIEFFESGARSKLPHIPFFVPVKKYTLDDPFAKYEKAGSDLIALTQVTTSHAVYISSSPTLANMVSHSPSANLKPTSMYRYQAINMFGLQIVSAQTGSEHRRHKNVAKGCFNESIMREVWDKMASACDTMIDEERLEEGGILKGVKHCMVKCTFLVIGQTGFGIKAPWHIPHTNGPVCASASDLLSSSRHADLSAFLRSSPELTMVPQLLLPMWFMTYSPFSHLRRCAKAQRSLVHHIKMMLKTRREELNHERAFLPAGEKVKAPTDILGALVASQMEVEDEARMGKGEGKIVGLTDKEVFGNTFIFIIAGHETTAHTLTWVLGYLALYPEIQKNVYKEIVEVCHGEQPSYRDMNAFAYTLAMIYESLRLRDLVMTLPKLVADDIIVPYTTWDAAGIITERSRLIKKGSHIIIDSPACQRNPQYWEDPAKFDPTRHLGQSGAAKSPGYTGFSMGVRQCIGKRFAEVEMVSLVVNLVRRFKLVSVPLDGETFEQTKKRYEKGSEELSFTPGTWDIKLERR